MTIEIADRLAKEFAFPRDQPLIGRTQELHVLDALLAPSSAGERVVLLQGEPGIGKTKLVTEFLRRTRETGRRVAQGSCYPIWEAGPYFPLLQILNQLRGEEVPFELHEEEAQSGSLPEDGQARRARLVGRLTSAILHEAARGDIVLCIEDLHWADLDSLLAVNDLLDSANAHLAIICTARSSEPMDAPARQLLNRITQRSRSLELAGLSPDELRMLLVEIPESQHLSPAELQSLWDFTRGNPLFVREFARHLRETNLLGRYRMAEAIERLGLPSNLVDVVDLRLAELPEETLAALSAGAVLGGEPSIAALAELLEAHEHDVQDKLEDASHKGIVVVEQQAGQPRLRFAHPLYERRLYDRLSAAQRRQLHRNAARAAEAGRIALSVEALARHYAYGPGRTGGRQAIASCRAAAERAEQLLAYESAARYWDLALRCTRAERRRARADICTRRGRALWAAGRWVEAMAAWERAIELFNALKLPRRAADVAAALGEMLRWRSDLEGAQRWLQRALAWGLPPGPERGRVLAILGGIYTFHGDERDTSTLDEARRNASGDPRTLYWLSYANVIAGKKEVAQALASKGLVEARRRGDSSATALLAASLFSHEIANLRADKAEPFAEIAAAAATPSDPATMIRSLLCSALLHGYRGDWRRVLEICENCMRQVRLASCFQVATASMFWAEARYALGDVPSAEQAIRDALPDLAEMHPVATMHLARVLAWSGRSAEAQKLLAWNMVVLDNKRATSAAGRAVLGEVASLIGDEELSERCYQALIPEERPLVAAYAPVSVQRVLGRLASQLKRWPSAIDHFETASSALECGGAGWELAATYLDYAEMRRQRGRRGDVAKVDALELQADAIYAELGHSRPPHRTATGLSPAGNRFGLTGREREVLDLVASGMRNQEIAEKLVLSTGTVNRHLENIYARMNVRNRAEAVVLAAREGLLDPPIRMGGEVAHTIVP